MEKVDVISPDKVYGRVEPVYHPTQGSSYLVKVLCLIVALVVLLAGGGLLLYHLSKNSVQVDGIPDERVTLNPKIENEATKAGITPALSETKDPAKQALEKEDAEKKMTEFLNAKRTLDDRGGSEWGGELYAELIQLEQEADALFMKEAYVSASTTYAEALSNVNRLNGQSTESLRHLLEEGRQALSAGDGERAADKFSVALMIDPGNEFAEQSLERAKKIETVIRLIKSGERHEQQENLSFALTDYREALELDPQFEKARTAFSRVKTMIAQDRFQGLMSSGFAAFRNKEYEVARTAFMEAQSFKPNSSEVTDALAQVDQAIRLAQIEGLRVKALAAEKTEDWDEALESYLAALKIDRAIQFAIRGKEYSQEMIRIENNIDFYLEKPGILESDRHLENAVLLLQECSEIDPKGLRLTEKVEKLGRLVKVAQTPVRITLESDNLTEVAIYQVGRLGRFHTRDLDLRPGTYTVVGTRDGYKDVREKMVVRSGETGQRLTLICKERI